MPALSIFSPLPAIDGASLEQVVRMKLVKRIIDIGNPFVVEESFGQDDVVRSIFFPKKFVRPTFLVTNFKP